MKVKEYDWVFSVVLSAGLRIVSSNLKNEDTAKSHIFVISTLFL